MYHFPSHTNEFLSKEFVLKAHAPRKAQQTFQKTPPPPMLCSLSPLLLFCSSVTDAAKLKLHRIYWGRASHQPELARLLPPGSSLAARAVRPWSPRLFPLNLKNEDRAQTNSILKQGFRELNVYFWRGRIRSAAGEQTLPLSY